MNQPRDKEDTVNAKTTVAALLSLMTAVIAAADSFQVVQTNYGPGPLEEHGGVFLPVQPEHNGEPTEWVFLVQGGIPPELNARPVADVWVLQGDTWQLMSDAAPAMYSHTLVVGTDGRAYAFGGVGGDDDFRHLDVVTRYQVNRSQGELQVTVEDIRVPGPNPGVCSDAAAVALEGSRSILHVGGFCNWPVLAGGSQEVWEYLIDANRWQRRADLPAPLSGHSAVVRGESVWVFGGGGPDGESNDLYRYDVPADTWAKVDCTGPEPDPRENHGAAIAGDTMLVFGGTWTPFFPETMDDVWKLDLETLTWSPRTYLPTGLAEMAVAVIPETLASRDSIQVLLHGGLVEAWSFPHRLSHEALIYTSDVLPSAARLAVPVVARVQGRGAFFTSSMTLFNGGPGDLLLQMTFTPREDRGGQPVVRKHTVPAGVMQTIDDPVGALLGLPAGAQWVGSVLLEPAAGSTGGLAGHVVVSARLDTGEEYGQIYPLMGVGQALGTGEVGHLATTEDAAANRVNVGLMATAEDTRLTVTPVTPLGTPLAEPRTVILDEGGNCQINDVHRAFGLGVVPNLVMEVAVEQGRALAYASVLDGNLAYRGTSDPTTILPVTAGSEQVTLLEIGSIVGGNEFSGSASITSFASSQALLEASFYRRGQPGVSSSRTLSLGAGETRGYSDLIGELFGVSGAVGSVVLRALDGARIAATGREFAVYRDAQGSVVGTAGQLIPGLSEHDLLAAGRAWHFVGLQQARGSRLTERSHLAVFNPGEEAVNLTVSVFDSDGMFEGSRTWTVRSQELIQINNVITEVNGNHDELPRRIEVVTTGPVYMHTFRVNRWGDPVTLSASSP